MKFSAHPSFPTHFSSDLLVLPVTESQVLAVKNQKKSIKSAFYTSPSLATLDALLGGSVSQLLSKRKFAGKKEEQLLLTGLSAAFPSILLAGFDPAVADTFLKHDQYRSLGAQVAAVAKEVCATNATLVPSVLSLDKETSFAAFVEGILLGGYEYTAYKSKKSETVRLQEVSIVPCKRIDDRFLLKAQTLAEATIFARDLINMPPNDCTPPYLVAVAKEVASQGRLKLQVFEKAQLEKMGAHSFLSVAKGTSFPPYLIKMTYAPVTRTAKTKVISLVGKGITYDTGGYSLKPGDSMIGMKGDMAGAASVLGVMKAVARLKPNVEVRGYIPTTENMINGEATRVGDIVKAMNGKSIEILNTDAEGRLILADALTLACKDKAHVVIDIATLTGACMVALGLQYAGVFSDDKKLTDDIIEQGAIAGERFWPLPLAPEYAASIKSSVADLKNIAGNRWAGATIGGLFLKEFVTPETRWAHLDIAGPSDADSSRGHIKQGGVGFAVRTLTRMILNQR